MNKDAPLLIGSSGQQSKSEEDELCEMDVWNLMSGHLDEEEECEEEDQYTEDMEEGDRVKSSVLDFEGAGFCNTADADSHQDSD